MGNQKLPSREIEHHEALYSGYAQQHFARPAVRAFRRHLAARILRRTGASRSSQVLSIGCGIGDTELLLAPSVRSIVGVDLSRAAIRQAALDARHAGVENVEFLEGDLASLQFAPASFDVAIAIFFMHHLPDAGLHLLAGQIALLLAPEGVFYGLDPSRYRLSGAIGKLVAPSLMKKHRSPDERELVRSAIRDLFTGSCFKATTGMYDFFSTPLAGLFPGAEWAYCVSRKVDDVVIRIPLLARIGSNFELIAVKECSKLT